MEEIELKAKTLRKNMTPHERKLWHHLKNKQASEIKFRRQQPIGNYIVDFVCYKKRLIIELDGGQHNETLNILYDKERTEFLEERGYKVIRFWNNEIDNNIEGVLEVIFENLK